nr:alcohol dehydrogenase catalytic domain-containing protein [Streptomyces sp. NBC_01001]
MAGGMKALLRAPDSGPGLELGKVPVPVPAAGEVLVRVLRTGICATDLLTGAGGPVGHPESRRRVAGHEFAGVVETTPVGGPAVGTLVSGDGYVACAACRPCRAGDWPKCPRADRLGWERDGAFAEYVALPLRNVWTHPPGTDPDTVVLFDPLGTAVRALTASPVVAQDVLVTGAGPAGLLTVAVARRIGARRVVVIDPDPGRRKLAELLGAHHAIDRYDSPPGDTLAPFRGGEDFACVVETSGDPTMIRLALGQVRPGGHVAAIGIATSPVEIDWNSTVRRPATLHGVGGPRTVDTWRIVSALLDGGLDPTPAITHHFAYEDYEAALEAARTCGAGKVVLEWSTLCASRS